MDRDNKDLDGVPYRIYLQFVDDDGNQLEEITWSEGKVYRYDIEYVLADPDSFELPEGDYYPDDGRVMSI